MNIVHALARTAVTVGTVTAAADGALAQSSEVNGWAHTIDPHRPWDVFKPLLACILEGDVELAPRILIHPA